MSTTARRPQEPDSHYIEEHRTRRPARSWDGCVRITGAAGAVEVPGTWHLDLPHVGRPLTPDPRRALPVPATGDLEAWRDHLLRLVLLRMPGTQLRVQAANAAGWQALEVAAATAPVSVLQIDRAGLEALLGPGATISLGIDQGSRGRSR